MLATFAVYPIESDFAAAPARASAPPASLNQRTLRAEGGAG